MKYMILLAFAVLLPTAHAQPEKATRFFDFTKQLERTCNKEFVTLEQARACKTGGTLVFGAPQSNTMNDYLVLVDQCTVTYQDAGAQFAPAIPAAELRAACQTGLVWARVYLQN